MHKTEQKSNGQMGDMENSSLDDAPGRDGKKLKLQESYLNDIRFGAETLRTTVKEKYLGREKGAKRGETDVAYGSSSTFQILVGLFMLGVLGGIYNQVNKLNKFNMY